MTNFALPLVVISWQRMLVEHFSMNDGETFFEKGNYEPQPKKNAKCPLDNLYLTGGYKKNNVDVQGQVFNFKEFTIKQKLSLGTWADKILQQDANFDMNRETTTKRRATEKDAIEKYTMSTNPIKWEKEKENETDNNNGVDDSQSKDKEDNYDCDDSKRIELRKNHFRSHGCC